MNRMNSNERLINSNQSLLNILKIVKRYQLPPYQPLRSNLIIKIRVPATKKVEIVGKNFGLFFLKKSGPFFREENNFSSITFGSPCDILVWIREMWDLHEKKMK